MKSSKKLAKFKANSCTTLQKDERTRGYFVEVPVEDYEELSIIKMNLLLAIELIFENRDNIEDQCDVTHSIAILIKLSKAFCLHEECMGLAKLFRE